MVKKVVLSSDSESDAPEEVTKREAARSFKDQRINIKPLKKQPKTQVQKNVVADTLFTEELDEADLIQIAQRKQKQQAQEKLKQQIEMRKQAMERLNQRIDKKNAMKQQILVAK
jgi:hypothetical protein